MAAVSGAAVRRGGVLVVGSLSAMWILYLVTATRTLPVHADTFANALTARSIAAEGTPALGWFDLPRRTPDAPRLAQLEQWIRHARVGPVAKYPPGAAVWGAGFYLLPGASDLRTATIAGQAVRIPPLWPAAAAAATATAVAVAAVVAMWCDGGATAVQAVVGAVLLGLGTGLWANAADELWQHGPAAMWLALGLLAASRGRWWLSGLAMGAAVVTRPPAAVVAAVVGLTLAGWRWRTGPGGSPSGPADPDPGGAPAGPGRSSGGSPRIRRLVAGPVVVTRPGALVGIGLGAGAGLAAYLGWNWWVYGEPTLSGGYTADYAARTVSQGLGWYVVNLATAVGSPRYGMVVWSPFLAVLAVGVRAGWRAASPAVRAGALGGLAYLLLQYRLNRSSGGGGFLSYRYPIEALVVAAPLGLEIWRQRIRTSPVLTRAFAVTATVAVVVHAVAAVVT